MSDLFMPIHSGSEEVMCTDVDPGSVNLAGSQGAALFVNPSSALCDESRVKNRLQGAAPR